MSVSPEVTPKFAASCQMSGLSAPCQAEGCSRPLCVWGVQEAEGLKDESSCKNTWATKKTSIDCFKPGRDCESKIASRKVAKAHVMILFFSSRGAGLCLRIFGQEGTLADDCIRFQLTAKEPQKSQDSRKGRERCNGPSPLVSLQSLHASSHIFLVKTCPSPLLFPFPLFFFSSFPAPQMGGWGVWRDGGQTHCECQT